MFELSPIATHLSAAAGAVAGAFVLRNLTGYSFGIETNKLDKALAATALVFASTTIVDKIKKKNDKENKKKLH